VDVPEPSPLFWEHVSARVRDAIAAEGTPQPAPWHERIRKGVLGRATAMRLLVPLSVAAAAAIVVAAVLTMNAGRSPVAVPLPTVAESAAPAEAVEGTSIMPPDDPALALVAGLGTQLDWDEIHDAGILARSGLMDRAVGELSAGERAELGKLLKLELAGGGN